MKIIILSLFVIVSVAFADIAKGLGDTKAEADHKARQFAAALCLLSGGFKILQTSYEQRSNGKWLCISKYRCGK